MLQRLATQELDGVSITNRLTFVYWKVGEKVLYVSNNNPKEYVHAIDKISITREHAQYGREK